MPIKRRAAKPRIARIKPEMIPLAERVLKLSDDHHAAIHGRDEPFYTDGRHAELVDLGSQLRMALGVKPWDTTWSLREALEEAKQCQ